MLGLEFDTFGFGLTHMELAGEPDSSTCQCSRVYVHGVLVEENVCPHCEEAE